MSQKFIVSLVIFSFFTIQINDCTEETGGVDFQSNLRDRRFLGTLKEKLGQFDPGRKWVKRRSNDLHEVKTLLLAALDKIDSFGEDSAAARIESESAAKYESTKNSPVSLGKNESGYKFEALKRKRSKKTRQKVRESGQRWGRWTEWSSCSVTCGKGREIRWRHCLDEICGDAETEMEEKTCQLPACPPGKLFGLFKL